MLEIIGFVRRAIEGSIVSILFIGALAVFGASGTINALLADRSVWSILFLLMLAVVLADLIARFIGIVSATFPDLIPKVDDKDLKRASLIKRLRPGPTVALLSSANAGQVLLFLVMFALLGTTYATAPASAQQTLFGEASAPEAIEAFFREGIAGSVGYFLFFLGPASLDQITDAIVVEPLVSSTVDGDAFLVGIRLYGLAFVLAVLRTLVTPISYIRARLRARTLPVPAQSPT